MNYASGTLLESSFPNVVLMPVCWKDGNNQHDSDGYRAVVDKNTGKLFSIVSSYYKLIRHEDAIAEVERAVERNRDLGSYACETDFYNEGARMRRTYRFTNVSVNITPGDSVKLELHLFNSYDLSWPFIIILGAFRIVCGNGLVVGKTYYHLRKRHVFDFADAALLDNLSHVIKRFSRQTNRWQKWTELPLTEKTYSDVFLSMKLGENAISEIESEANRQSWHISESGMPIVDLWGFYNLLTWYITHRAVSLNHRVTMEASLRRALKYFHR